MTRRKDVMQEERRQHRVATAARWNELLVLENAQAATLETINENLGIANTQRSVNPTRQRPSDLRAPLNPTTR